MLEGSMEIRKDLDRLKQAKWKGQGVYRSIFRFAHEGCGKTPLWMRSLHWRDFT